MTISWCARLSLEVKTGQVETWALQSEFACACMISAKRSASLTKVRVQIQPHQIRVKYSSNFAGGDKSCYVILLKA